MKKWMPLKGNFVEDNETIIFQGVSQHVSNMTAPANSLISWIVPDGIVLFEDRISSGSITMNVQFEKMERGDLAQIVFNYQNPINYMCAGITNDSMKYSFNFFNGQPNIIYATGQIDELPTAQFEIQLRLIGSFLELYINKIKVLAYAIPFMVNCTHAGIWVKSKNKITISDIEMSHKQPEAFIVSQFGGDYDILYDEVIKPLSKKFNYEPIRADEVTSSSMILNDIIVSIRNAVVIIADITPDNPNVFYEIGYAHALGKPTILLCEKSVRDKLPFDISGFRTIFYDNSIGGKRKVEEKLGEYLRTINESIGTGNLF